MPTVVSTSPWVAGLGSASIAAPTGLVVGNLVVLLVAMKPAPVRFNEPGTARTSDGGSSGFGAFQRPDADLQSIVSTNTGEAQGADTGPLKYYVFFQEHGQFNDVVATTISHASSSPIFGCMIQVGRLASEGTRKLGFVRTPTVGSGVRNTFAGTSFAQAAVQETDDTTLVTDRIIKVDDLFVATLMASGNTVFSTPQIVRKSSLGTTNYNIGPTPTYNPAQLSTTTGNDGAIASWSTISDAEFSPTTGWGTQQLIVGSVLSVAEFCAGHILQIRAFQPALAPPTNLTATQAEEDQVTLNWTAVAGATSYRVYRDEDNKPNPVFVKEVTGLTATDSAYNAGGIYRPNYNTTYRVTSVNSDGIEGTAGGGLGSPGTVSGVAALGRPTGVGMRAFTRFGQTEHRIMAVKAKRGYDEQSAFPLSKVSYRLFVNGVAHPGDIIPEEGVTTYPVVIASNQDPSITYNYELQSVYTPDGEAASAILSAVKSLNILVGEGPEAHYPSYGGWLPTLGRDPTNDPTYVKVIGVSDNQNLPEAVGKEFLLEPDKTKYIEVTNQNGFGSKQLFIHGESARTTVNGRKVFDGTQPPQLAVYYEVMKYPAAVADPNVQFFFEGGVVFVDGFGEPVTGGPHGSGTIKNFAGLVHAGDLNTPRWVVLAQAADSMEDAWFVKQLKTVFNGTQNVGQTWRWFWKYTHQVPGGSGAVTGAFVIRIYALAIIVKTKEAIADVPVTATGSNGAVRYSIAPNSGPTADPLFSSAGVYNRLATPTANDGRGSQITNLRNDYTNEGHARHPVEFPDPAKDDYEAFTFERNFQSHNVPMDEGVPLPVTPTVVVVSAGDKRNGLIWNRVHEFYRTHIFRAEGNVNGVYVQVADIPAGEASWIDTDVVNGRIYFYRLRSHYAAKNVTGLLNTSGGNSIKSRRAAVLLPAADIASSGLFQETGSDNFDRADSDNVVKLGPLWRAFGVQGNFSSLTYGWRVAGNRARANIGGSSSTAAAFALIKSHNGESTVTWSVVVASMGHMVRGLDSDSGLIGAGEVIFLFQTGDLQYNGNTKANVGRALVAGDVTRIVHVGSNIKVYLNGALVIDHTIVETGAGGINYFSFNGNRDGIFATGSQPEFDDFSMIGYEVAPYFSRLDDGYLAGDKTQKVSLATSTTVKETVLDVALSDKLANELLDTTDTVRLFLSARPPQDIQTFVSSNSTHYALTTARLELWQGAPGTGVLVARRRAGQRETNGAIFWKQEDSRQRAETEIVMHDILPLTTVERALITDANALTMRFAAQHEWGDKWSDRANVTLPSLVSLNDGGEVSTANASVSGGSLVLAASSSSSLNGRVVFYGPRGRMFKGLRAKWTGSGAGTARFVLAMTDSANAVNNGIFMVVTPTSILVQDRYFNQAQQTLLDFATTNVVGDAFEMRHNSDFTVSVFKNGTFVATSTPTVLANNLTPASRNAGRQYPVVKNENFSGTVSFQDTYVLAAGSESWLLYDMGVAVPSYDPSELYPISSDNSVVTEDAVRDIAVEKFSGDTGAAAQEKTSLLISKFKAVPPDVIEARMNATGEVANVRDDPTTPDGLEIVGGTGVVADVRLGFELPLPGELFGEQKFRLRLREP